MLQDLFSPIELQLMGARYVHGTRGDPEHFLFAGTDIFVVEHHIFNNKYFVAIPGLYDELDYVLPVDVKDDNDIRVKIIEVIRMLKAGELA